MAGELGRTTTDLENDLLENGPEYDYFQAVRMIGLLANQKKREEGGVGDYRLRIRPELSFNYPTSDIAEIRQLEPEPGFAITTTFLGLYGVSSPLPAFFTEELLDDEWEDDDAPRGFLDVIHQHIYPLLYGAWVKYKFSHNAIEHADESYWDILYNLIGLGGEDIKAAVSQPEQLLRYVGLLTEQRRSAAGLQTILEDLLSPLRVELEPCVERTVTIPEEQRLHLGVKHCKLGETAVLGMQVNDRTGKLIVRIGPLDAAQYVEFIADEKKLELVRFIIKMYLRQPLDYEVALSLSPNTVKGVCLGEKMWTCLGADSWLFSNGNTETVQMSV